MIYSIPKGLFGRFDAGKSVERKWKECFSIYFDNPHVEQFVADGVFFAELNEVLTRELAEDGYSGVEVRVTPMRTEIIIRATRTQNVLGISLI